MKRGLLVATLLLAACVNTKDEYLTEFVCVQSHMQMTVIVVPVSCGKNCTRMATRIIPYTVCDKSERHTYRNPNYKADNNARK